MQQRRARREAFQLVLESSSPPLPRSHCQNGPGQSRMEGLLFVRGLLFGLLGAAVLWLFFLAVVMCLT